MIHTLLKYGADPTIKDAMEVGNNTAMHLAVAKNMPQVLHLFLAVLPEGEVEGESLAVKKLEEKNSVGFTILHIAASKGFAEIVMMLMETGKYNF